MQYAIIENNAVINIVEADSELAHSKGWVEATGAKIGSTWDGEVFTDPQPVVPDPKIVGVEILGIMCSATRDDQNGLTAVALGITLARMSATAFPDTRFEFANGNSLVVTNDNFDHVYSTWMPFRQSFFAAE